MTTVEVEKRKYPARPASRWTATVVGDDEHGLWLFTPTGTPHRVAREPEPWIQPVDGVQLLPRDEWWCAWFWSGRHSVTGDRWAAVDVATPPTFDEATRSWSYEDLELDVVWGPGLDVHVVDEDEFEEVRAAGAYPGHVATAAMASCADVVRRIATGTEPFASVGWGVLATEMSRRD